MCFKRDRELYKQYTKPRRKCAIVVPLQMLLIWIFLCGATVFFVINRVWGTICGVACVGLAVATVVWLVLFWRKCNREDCQLSKDKYAYLWKTEFAEGEEFETTDEETGMTYTVQKDGLKAVFPIFEEYEQVFEEVAENVEFIPWSRTRLALATCNTFFSVKLALAVLDVGTAQIEEDGEASYEEPFIIPMSEKLVCAVKSFGLEEKTCENWAYLFYNPDDAVRQIYKKGYIRVKRDKNTGKKNTLGK